SGPRAIEGIVAARKKYVPIVLSEDATAAKLLEEIVAAPEDDGPRLVLADWLQERGDPRGELIVIQCQLAKGGAVGRVERQHRERELLEKHRKDWVAAFNVPRAQWIFVRGFVERAMIAFEHLVEALPPLFRAEPIREIAVEKMAEGAEGLDAILA